MFTFLSPVNPKHVWELRFRDAKELENLFYEGNKRDEKEKVLGFTDIVEMVIYADKNLDGYGLARLLRHEMTHVYLWETAQHDVSRDEERLADFIGVAAPVICETVDKIMLRLKEGWYKHGE